MPPVPGAFFSRWRYNTAGGTNDIAARILASLLEKEPGTPIQVVNKAGAGSQIGLTEGAQVKPDGYNLTLMVLPPAANVYMNPNVKPQFNRESFIPIAVFAVDPMVIAVRGDSLFKTAKDLVDALSAAMAKVANGDEFKKKAGEAGILPNYMDQKAYIKHWDDIDALVKPLLPKLLQTANQRFGTMFVALGARVEDNPGS